MNETTYNKAKEIKSEIVKKQSMLKILKEKDPKLVYEDCMGYRKIAYLSKTHIQTLKELIEKEIAELEKEFEEL